MNIYTPEGKRHLVLMPSLLLIPPPASFGAGAMLSPRRIMVCRKIRGRQYSSPSTTLSLTLPSEFDFCYPSGWRGKKS